MNLVDGPEEPTHLCHSIAGALMADRADMSVLEVSSRNNFQLSANVPTYVTDGAAACYASAGLRANAEARGDAADFYFRTLEESRSICKKAKDLRHLQHWN